MPTKVEFDELLNNCQWEWTTKNEVNGYKVIGPNGNSIFLPAAGCRAGTSLDFAGEYGGYWSSTPGEDDTSHAYDFDFRSGDPYVTWNDRQHGISVRSVTD